MPPFVFCIQDCYYIRAAYQNPRPHRHFAAHVLIGLDGPFITEIDGKHMQALPPMSSIQSVQTPTSL